MELYKHNIDIVNGWKETKHLVDSIQNILDFADEIEWMINNHTTFLSTDIVECGNEINVKIKNEAYERIHALIKTYLRTAPSKSEDEECEKGDENE